VNDKFTRLVDPVIGYFMHICVKVVDDQGVGTTVLVSHQWKINHEVIAISAGSGL